MSTRKKGRGLKAESLRSLLEKSKMPSVEKGELATVREILGGGGPAPEKKKNSGRRSLEKSRPEGRALSRGGEEAIRLQIEKKAARQKKKGGSRSSPNNKKPFNYSFMEGRWPFSKKGAACRRRSEKEKKLSDSAREEAILRTGKKVSGG